MQLTANLLATNNLRLHEDSKILRGKRDLEHLFGSNCPQNLEYSFFPDKKRGDAVV